MKKQLILLLTAFCFNQCFGQISNIKTGLWSDTTVWNNNRLPTASDEISLSFDITVDINASVQSLTLNGHNVVVNSNVNLNILGDANTIMLSKFIEIDTTMSAPLDTISKELFYYDLAKRNTGIELLFYDGGQITNNQYKSTFFYNGNDTVPYKKIVISPLLNQNDEDFINDTCFYAYINSLLVTDSTIQYSNTSRLVMVNKYEYTNNRIINTSTSYMFNPMSISIEKDTVYLEYVNGNITSQIDTSQFFAKQDFRYVYDNHPNPFYRTQSKVAIENRFPYYSMETFIRETFAKNNALEINQYFQDSYNFHLKCIYEYKPNGYPKIVRFYDQNDPTLFSKGLYFYTN